MERLLNTWVPVAFGSEVAAAPIRVVVAGFPIVVWRDSAHRIAAIHDRCSHRGALLSRGTVVGDQVRCPYHGLQFDASGICSFASGGANRRLKSFVCREDFGVIWITQDARAPFALSELLAPDVSIRYQLSDSVMCNAYDLIENLVDVAHFPFVHVATFSSPDLSINADDVSYVETEYGFDCEYKLPIVPSGEFEQLVSGEAREVEVVGRYIAPLTQLFYVRYNTGLSYASAQCVLPVSDRETRFMQFAFGDLPLNTEEDKALFRADHAVWLEDKAVLESIQRSVAPDWSGVRCEFDEPHSVNIAKALRRLHAK